MGKVLKSLQLQFFFILCIVYVKAAPYSKYGRKCTDIGCLPREVCIIAYDTCSFNQQEGTNCGKYPTCIKADRNQQQQPPAQNTGPSNPSPTTPSLNIWNLPTTTPSTTTRRTTTTTTTRRAWTTKPSFYNPSNPSYGGGGSYYGDRYGGDSFFGGSSRTTTRATTRRPSSSSSSSGFDGIFSGFSNFLSGEGGKLLQGILSNRGGSGSSGGGFSSLFGGGDTRPLMENRSRGGFLFSENTSNRNNDYSAYPVTRYGEASQPQQQPSSSSASHGSYGWKLS